MPPKPSAAARRSVSTGKVSASSHSRANGIISSRAKARAVSWMARCSSVRSKSMAVTGASSAVNHWPKNRKLPIQYNGSASTNQSNNRRNIDRRVTLFGSAEHPRRRILNRLVFVQGKQAFDVAHQRPDEPPEQYGNADDDEQQHRPDHQIQ